MLAQREEIAFVQLVCFACQTETLTLVTGAPATEDDASGLGEGVLGDLLAGGTDDAGADAGDDGGRADRPQRPPVNEVDVLEMRAYLAEYQGDVHGLFDGRPDAPDAGDETGAAQ